MVTKRALRSISMPCLASLYKGCPSFLSAEYIGGTCSISPAHVDIAQTIKFAELEALAGDDFAQLDAKIFKSEDLLPNIHSVRVDEQQGIDYHFHSPKNQADEW
jgi:hypothetical protein